MPVECPNCRQPIARYRLFFRTAWSRWRCDGCGSLLGIDIRRRFLAVIPWIAILFFLLRVVHITRLGLLIALPTIICAGLLNFFLLDRAVVHERTGFRCRKCGYDLQGQTESRCPECGLVFDSAELATYKAKPDMVRKPQSRWGFRIATALLIGLITALLIMGLIFFRAGRARTARMPATIVSTQVSTQAVPTTEPAGFDEPMNHP